MSKKLLSTLLLSTFVLMSCNGENEPVEIAFNGSNAEATVSAQNAEKLAMAATGGASQAIASNIAPKSTLSTSASLLLDLSNQINETFANTKKLAASHHVSFCISGSVDSQTNLDNSITTITYKDCEWNRSDGAILNGVAIRTIGIDQESTLVYRDFNITYQGETYTLNLTIHCASYYNCSLISDYAGPDRRIYRVSDYSVISVDTDRYTITARVYDPDHGYIAIEADITYSDCAGGVPESGTIGYTGSDSSYGSITFIDCGSFTVNQGGDSVAYNWGDIL